MSWGIRLFAILFLTPSLLFGGDGLSMLLRLEHLMKQVQVVDQQIPADVQLEQESLTYQELQDFSGAAVDAYQGLLMYFHFGDGQEIAAIHDFDSRFSNLRNQILDLHRRRLSRSPEDVYELQMKLPEFGDVPTFLGPNSEIRDFFHPKSDEEAHGIIRRLKALSPGTLILRFDPIGSLIDSAFESSNANQEQSEPSATTTPEDFIVKIENRFVGEDNKGGWWMAIPSINSARAHYFFFVPANAEWPILHLLGGRTIEVWKVIQPTKRLKAHLDFVAEIPNWYSDQSEGMLNLPSLKILSSDNVAGLSHVHPSTRTPGDLNDQVYFIEGYYGTNQRQIPISIDQPLLPDDFGGFHLYRQRDLPPVLSMNGAALRHLRTRIDPKFLTIRMLLELIHSKTLPNVNGLSFDTKACAEALSLIRAKNP